MIKRHNRKSVARRRWTILAQALVRSRMRDISPDWSSTRKFHGFGLISFQKIGHGYYTVTSQLTDLSVIVRLVQRDFDPSELSGFNNTGNVCIWPSEELLLHYCLRNMPSFKRKAIIELGGGMTCLAGLFISANNISKHICLTDGNSRCIDNVKLSVQKNNFLSSPDVRILRWGNDGDERHMEEKFDTVLCADCIFFDDSRLLLVKTLRKLMKPGAIAVVTAPNRNDTFNLFAELCKPYFSVAKTNYYDEIVAEAVDVAKQNPYYVESHHYPLLLVLRKL